MSVLMCGSVCFNVWHAERRRRSARKKGDEKSDRRNYLKEAKPDHATTRSFLELQRQSRWDTVLTLSAIKVFSASSFSQPSPHLKHIFLCAKIGSR